MLHTNHNIKCTVFSHLRPLPNGGKRINPLTWRLSLISYCSYDQASYCSYNQTSELLSFLSGMTIITLKSQ